MIEFSSISWWESEREGQTGKHVAGSLCDTAGTNVDVVKQQYSNNKRQTYINSKPTNVVRIPSIL